MIGEVGTGASFYECIRYCLEDKRELTDEQKIEKSQIDGLQHKDRAEVLDYNLCFGDAKRLASQFIQVSKLSSRVEKPVFHFSLRLATGDVLTKEQWIEVGRQCAKEFGVHDNQCLIILHKDTKEPHIHIVANRVGFDGKVAKDTYSIKRMHALCRRLEKEFHLTEVLSARAFLPKEQRDLPRHDSRKEKLKRDIQKTLEHATTFSGFEEKMKSLGYKVIKGRGISFIDEKKVKIKGSEVGFSLSKIESILGMKQQIAQREEILKAKQKLRDIKEIKSSQQPEPLISKGRLLRQLRENEQTEELSIEEAAIETLKNAVKEIIYELFKTEYADQSVAPELLKEAKRKKKRQNQKP